MANSRSRFGTTVYNNNIFVFGSSTSAEKYDIAGNTWYSVPSTINLGHSGGGIYNNKLYAIGGGYSPTSKPIAEEYEYDESNSLSSAYPIYANNSYNEKINFAGDYDYFKIIPTEDNYYSFYSTGNTDTYAYLYDSNGVQITYNDDSGAGYNFYILRKLTANTTYYLAVRHYNSSSTGDYTLNIDKSIYYKKLTAIGNSSKLIDVEISAKDVKTFADKAVGVVYDSQKLMIDKKSIDFGQNTNLDWIKQITYRNNISGKYEFEIRNTIASNKLWDGTIELLRFLKLDSSNSNIKIYVIKKIGD